MFVIGTWFSLILETIGAFRDDAPLMIFSKVLLAHSILLASDFMSGNDSSPYKSGGFRLLDSTVSLKMVMTGCAFLLAQTMTIGIYLHISFSSIGTRLTTLETTVLNETAVRKIISKDSKWAHASESIQDLIGRHDTQIDKIDDRLRNIEMMAGKKTAVLDRLVSVIEMNAKTRQDAREAARIRQELINVEGP